MVRSVISGLIKSGEHEYRGTWRRCLGTALAIYLSARHRVTLWTRNTKHLTELAAQRVNQRYLPGQRLPDTVHFACKLNDVLKQAELVLWWCLLRDCVRLCSR